MVNARSFADWRQMPMFLEKTKVLFAFLVTASTWVFQERFLEIPRARSRYFAESTCWSMCPYMV